VSITKVGLGRNAKFFLNGGTFGSPNWSAVPNISDCAVNAVWDEADASTRESAAKMTVKTLLGLEIDVKLKYDVTDANTAAIMSAMVSPSGTVDILVLNGSSATNGVIGYRMDSQVFQANEDQSLGVAEFEDLKFKPTPYNGNAPASAAVASAAPVFTTL
jgi:hypothetical protein